VTKLEAVNEMLESIMEAQVAALDTGNTSAEGIAETILDRYSTRIQTIGWHENTDYDLTLPYPTHTIVTSSVVGTFVVGETVTGGTSAATGKFYQIDTSNLMWLHTITGTFQAAETLTGGTSAATATSGTVATVTTGNIFVESDVLKVDTYGKDADLDIVLRGRKLYKPKTQSFDFDADIKTTQVKELDFINLSNPELVSMIVAESSKIFQRRTIGGRTQDAFLSQESSDKTSKAHRMDAINQDLNILDFTLGRQILGRSNANMPRR